MLAKKISVLCKVVGQWHRPCDKSTLTRRLCKRTPLQHQGRKVKVTTAVVDKIEKWLSEMIVKADGQRLVTVADAKRSGATLSDPV